MFAIEFLSVHALIVLWGCAFTLQTERRSFRTQHQTVKLGIKTWSKYRQEVLVLIALIAMGERSLSHLHHDFNDFQQQHGLTNWSKVFAIIIFNRLFSKIPKSYDIYSKMWLLLNCYVPKPSLFHLSDSSGLESPSFFP